MLRVKSLELWLLAIAAIFFFAQSLFQKPSQVVQTAYVAPPLELKYVTFGYSTQVSDSFWLRAVQDTQFCEREEKSGVCVGKSWFYNVINLVIELDENFTEAYYYGGLALTALIHDVAGATAIFDRGTAKIKHEWQLSYLAAYHALFEEKDALKASKLYLTAAENGAPAWVRLSAGKLAVNGGDNASAIEILEQLIKLESDPRWIKQLKQKLAEKTKLESLKK